MSVPATHLLSLLTNLTAFDPSPFEPLRIQGESKQRREENRRLQSNFLSLIVLRLCGPVKEGNNILCILRRRSWGACARHKRGAGEGVLRVSTYHHHTRQDRQIAREPLR